MATSYANPGGSGDRTTTVVPTISTASVFFNATYANNWTVSKRGINGDTTNEGGFTSIWADRLVANEWLKFDFGAGESKVIDEAKFYQSSTTTQTHGTWKWQGSNDDSGWTDVGSTFTLGGSAVQTQTSMSGNTTGYRYYRLLGIAGSSSSNSFADEFEFKIDNAAVASSIIPTNRISTRIGLGV